MTVKLRNNVVSSLRTELLSSSTTVILPVGHGVRFPSLGAGEYFYATIEDAAGNSEIVQATARATDTLTVVRGAEGTTPRTFAAGSTVEMRVTAASVLDAASDAADAVDLTTFGVTASAAELNILDGVTASTAEINVLAGITATTAELNILDGVTASTAELNILDGVTASTAEINILDGVTASTAELNILDGVTASTAELNQLDNNTFTGDITIQDKIVHAGDTNTSIRFPSNDTITMETDGVERFKITSAGNVGIGTSAPASPLDVVSNSSAESLTIRGRTADNLSTVLFKDNANTATYATIGGSPTRLNFAVGGSERMRITSSGNVGIGTTNPTATLHVDGTIAGTAFAGLGNSVVLLGTMTTTSGSTVTLSGLDLTPYKFLEAYVDGVGDNTTTSRTVSFEGASIGSTSTTAANRIYGKISVELATGVGVALTTDYAPSTKPQSELSIELRQLRLNTSNASTSLSLTISGGTFAAGSVRIYGVK